MRWRRRDTLAHRLCALNTQCTRLYLRVKDNTESGGDAGADALGTVERAALVGDGLAAFRRRKPRWRAFLSPCGAPVRDHFAHI